MEWMSVGRISISLRPGSRGIHRELRRGDCLEEVIDEDGARVQRLTLERIRETSETTHSDELSVFDHAMCGLHHSVSLITGTFHFMAKSEINVRLARLLGC